jgi:hypothetical protein
LTDTLQAYKQILEKDREQKRKERTALLAMVDAIEEYLDMPKTSEIRQFAKDNGFYDRYRICRE